MFEEKSWKVAQYPFFVTNAFFSHSNTIKRTTSTLEKLRVHKLWKGSILRNICFEAANLEIVFYAKQTARCEFQLRKIFFLMFVFTKYLNPKSEFCFTTAKNFADLTVFISQNVLRFTKNTLCLNVLYMWYVQDHKLSKMF